MFWILVATAASLGLVALVARQLNWGTAQISGRFAAGILCAVSVIVVVACIAEFLITGARPNRPPQSYPSVVSSSAAPAAASEPLAVGTMAPGIKAEGWINHDPNETIAQAKVMLVDIWGQWCPACGESAPGLVEIYNKYQRQDLAFFSLTSDSREVAANFVSAHHIPWPSGYGVSRDYLASFGALNGAAAMVGYDSVPTLYLLDAEGHILWSDLQQRFHHKDVSAVLKELQSEIDKALADSSNAVQ